MDGLGLGSGDDVDQAFSELEASLIAASINADVQTAKQARAALRRIAKAQYGICESCGQQIPGVRLRALPWATRCVPCQQAVEAELGLRGRTFALASSIATFQEAFDD